MQILSYIVAVLLILGSMTYARMHSYRLFSGLKVGFNQYIEQFELLAIEQNSLETYKKIHVQTHGEQGSRQKKADGTRRISFYLFLNKEVREQNLNGYSQTRALLKTLVTQMFGQQKFFKEIAEKRANFLDEILDGLQNGAEQSLNRASLKNVESIGRLLANQDEALYNAFYYMLAGIQKPIDHLALNHEIEDVDDEHEAELNVQDSRAAPGCISLLNYTTLNSKYKIRVYLADPAILMAIYEDSGVVEKIVELRQELYKRVRTGLNLDEATAQFEQAFSNIGRAPAYVDILNFAVTKVNPKS